MDSAMDAFREAHEDPHGKVLLLYTPVNNFTNLIMQHTMEKLGLQHRNRLFRHGQDSTGVVGMSSEIEMIERAMFHRKDFVSHGKPAAVLFRISDHDRSNVTGMPYNIEFFISLFDDTIIHTADKQPFIEPADTESWRSPYITSGFVGLQYAIEQSITRLILEMQREAEMKELSEAFGPALEKALKDGENSTETVDEHLFAFMETAHGPHLKKEGHGEEPKKKERSAGTSKNAKPLVMRRRMIKSASELPERTLKMFTYNMFGPEDYRRLLTFVVTFSCVAAYAFMSFFIVRQIARENLAGIKDILTIHGLPHYVHWALLLLHALIFRGITTIMVLLAWKTDFGNGSIIKNGSTTILFFLIYFHQLAITFMNFFIAICIRSVGLSGIVAVATGILSFYLPETFYEMELLGNYTDFLLTMIFPNWCVRHVIRCLLDYETDEKGISIENLFEVAHVDTNRVTVGGGLLRLILMMIVYYSLAAYIDMTSAAKLFQQTYKWYQCKVKAKEQEEIRALHEQLVQDIDEGQDGEFERASVYEEPSEDKKCFVHIRNLSKNYGKHKIALDHVNMNIMHEEVTVILGHSGCGKSTLISILAGLIQPTDGYAVVKGFDVQYDTTKAREYIGMCPQKLVAFNLLNVLQHVKLCYMLRGYSSSECWEPVRNILTKLRLWKVRSLTPGGLTNDELRRLGMAMALADTPKVLLLDQPTHGMDSIGRKEMWDIIHTLKRHHTIVIATNCMDEAEQLADRLAFMAYGRLICYGTKSFLEAQYDTGYFMKILPNPQTRLNSNVILNLVKRYFNSDDIFFRQQTRITEVDNLVLGLPATDLEKLTELCDELEGNKDELNIHRYSIRRVNLNDVFIRICSSVSWEGEVMDLYVKRNTAGALQSPLFAEIPRLKREEPSEMFLDIDDDDDDNQRMTMKEYFIALLRKRWIVIKSGGYSVCFRFVIPLIFVWIVVFQAKLFVETTSQNPAREMTIESFQRDRHLHLFYRIGKDDPTVNYDWHLARILAPYGSELGKMERVLTKMYEVLNTEPGNAGYVKDDHMIAFEFRRLGSKGVDMSDFIGYFSSGAMHSPPLTLSIMANVYLSAISAGEWPQNTTGRKYRIVTINNPMPLVKVGKFEDGCGGTCILLSILMSVSISFMSHYCFILPMMERTTGMKHLQLMCGVPSRVYWFADYVVDCAIMFPVSCCIIIIYLADLSQTFYSAAVIFSLWLICILYLLWSGVMYAYYMSTIIPKSMNGYNVMTLLHISCGIIPFLWLTLSKPGSSFGQFFRNALEVLFPPYTITAVFYNFLDIVARRDVCSSTNPYLQQICDVHHKPHNHTINTGHYNSERRLYNEITKNDPKFAQCCDRICLVNDTCLKPPNMLDSSNESWENPGIVTDCVALFLQGFIFCGLLILSDKRPFQTLAQKCILKYMKGQEETETSGVPKRYRSLRRESIAVHTDKRFFPKDVALFCIDLTKSSASKMIINNFCLEVKKGQCIGILGRGDSGKSCVAKMISGQILPTKGNCFIAGADLIYKRKKYLSSIGYCPQMNCLYPELTGFQILELMGQLRGIPQSLLDTHVVKWLDVMGLSEVAHEQCKEYGGGICQRLRAAMAFIGEPEIILLDEPTSSVDPNSRERLWSIMDHLKQQGHTIIFTTYSTDEAFNIADKVVVIADGSVQNIGEPEELQKTYGRGHTIMFKLKRGVFATKEIIQVAADKVKTFKQNVQKTFRFIDLLDEQHEVIMYFLRDVQMTWAEVYRRANFLATVHPDVIEYYEVSEGEVDNIFVFTNKLREMGTPHKGETREYTENLKGEAAMKEIRKAQKRLKRVNF